MVCKIYTRKIQQSDLSIGFQINNYNKCINIKNTLEHMQWHVYILSPWVWCSGKILGETSKRISVQIPLGINILDVDLLICISCAPDLPDR